MTVQGGEGVEMKGEDVEEMVGDGMGVRLPSAVVQRPTSGPPSLALTSRSRARERPHPHL